MMVFNTRNVQRIFPFAVQQLLSTGVRRQSRNGPVLVFPRPVSTVYARPVERVLFHPERNANPFFHLAEALWMLAGRNDVEFITKYVDRMRSYSDDGQTFHGAYGHRWRKHFGQDQLNGIIEALQKDPDDRRQVLTMWDPEVDLGRSGRDVPCNTQAYFQVGCDGRLNMLVTNRSNDIIWGAYGANAVHFSILHEYMARCIGVGQGTYTQVSMNFHAYVDVLDKVKEVKNPYHDPYADTTGAGYHQDPVRPFPLVSTSRAVWEADLQRYMGDGPKSTLDYQDPFFRLIAAPMAAAYSAHKNKDPEMALGFVRSMPPDNDWRLACLQWLERRYNKEGK